MGNRNRDLPAFTAMPEPTAPPRAPDPRNNVNESSKSSVSVNIKGVVGRKKRAEYPEIMQLFVVAGKTSRSTHISRVTHTHTHTIYEGPSMIEMHIYDSFTCVRAWSHTSSPPYAFMTCTGTHHSALRLAVIDTTLLLHLRHP